MKYIISFFTTLTLTVSVAGELPCDLVRKDPSYSIGYIKNSKGFCSGVLVSPHLVLTAGHCVKGEEPAAVKFSLSSSAAKTISAPAQKLVLHPSYWKARDGSAGGLDFALILLENTAYGDVPAYFLPLLSSSELLFGETMVSWGFGLQDGGDRAKRHKKEVIFSGRENAPLLDGRNLKDGRIVFRRGQTGEIQCSGDSGGPVLHEINGRWNIVGINSRSAANIKYSSRQGLKHKLASKEYFCHHSDKFICANVGNAMDWIQENIKNHETDNTQPRCGK